MLKKALIIFKILIEAAFFATVCGTVVVIVVGNPDWWMMILISVAVLSIHQFVSNLIGYLFPENP